MVRADKALFTVSLALAFVSLPARADSYPTKINVQKGSIGGNAGALAAAGEGKAVNLYSNGKGSLAATFIFSGVSAGTHPIAGTYKQQSVANKFSLQAIDASGALINLGQLPASKSYASFSFTLPATAVKAGAVRLRIAGGPNVGDVTFDMLAVRGTTDTGTATETATQTATQTSTSTDTSTGVLLPPTGKISWDWQIGATSEAKIIPPAGARLIDLDGFNTSAAKIAQLKAQGIYTVCYIDAGSWEKDRPDSDQYPSYLKIYYDSAWGEWFLDVTDVFRPDSVLATILRNRIKMCKDKGFDALEPDNLQNDENAGGKISLQQQLDFNGWVADVAHEYGLAVFQKNGPDKVLLKDRTGKMMVEKFDAILNEECQAYKECGPLAEYTERGKLALDVEYKKAMTLDCATSNALQMNEIKKDLNLVGGGDAHYVRQVCP